MSFSMRHSLNIFLPFTFFSLSLRRSNYSVAELPESILHVSSIFSLTFLILTSWLLEEEITLE